MIKYSNIYFKKRFENRIMNLIVKEISNNNTK